MQYLLWLMMAVLAVPLMAQPQPDNMSNLRLLVKDSGTYARLERGMFDHPALEIGTRKGYTQTNGFHYPIRIAIDPGHLATNRKEAVVEERYVNSRYGFFYESELNMATALLLKTMFEARGFEVMVTRSASASAYGEPFLKWYRKHFRSELAKDLERGKISQERYEELHRASAADVFHKYYKDKDLLARGNKINAFAPDLTLCIHYNATEFDNSTTRFSPEVNYNYAVCFVPGGFTNLELQREDHLEDFIRLASSDAILKSVRLSACIAHEFETKLGVPCLMPEDNPNLWYLKKYSVYTGVPGIYSRNLFMTRAVEGPVCYAECFLQNNAGEIRRLAQKDLVVGGLKVSSRVKDVAECYYAGVLKYFSLENH